MRIEQMLNSTGGSTLKDFNAQIQSLQQQINAAKAGRDGMLTASNNWAVPAWEDSSSNWRKGDFNNFRDSCVRTSLNSHPCVNDNQTGRGNRYRDRITKARDYWFQSETFKKRASDLEALLADVEKEKDDYLAALNEGTSQGLDTTQVDTIYQQNLENLQAQEDAINAQTEAAQKSAEQSAMTKYYIIGGVAVLLIGFFIMRRKK